MKKGQVYEATVERVDFPAKGIARTEEGTVTVKNSLPGQKIKLGISKVRNGKAEGRLLEVLEKSPLETDAPCSHFGVCGGCTYLSLPYEEQLRVKEGQVKRLLDACLEGQEEEWKWEGIKGSPEVYGYRNKMEFTFGDDHKGGPLTLGMHKRGSFYDVVTVDGCRIVDEDYRLILSRTLEYFASFGGGGRGVRYYHRMRHEGYLRHLVVRKAARTGEILVALVTSSQSPWGECAEARKVGVGNDIAAEISEAKFAGSEMVSRPEAEIAETVKKVEKLEHTEAVEKSEKTVTADEAEERIISDLSITEEELISGFLECLLELEQSGSLKGHFAGILHIINDSKADVVQSDRTKVLYGQDYFYEELMGLRFKISIFSFFQTNTAGAEVLYETAREYVGELGSGADGVPDKVVYDLYSGTGTIAQMMASAARRVIGVEIVEEAVEAAVRNARENGLENCSFIAGDVLKVLDTIAEKPDFIILDPPRDGIHPKALPKIISYGVEQIVYISCKPTSLARDLVEFRKGGYRVVRACCVDMFPHTANVETVCLLSNTH